MKMIFADVKANAKLQEIKELVAVSYQFFVRSTFKTLKKAFIFHLTLVSIPSRLILCIKISGGVVGVYLTDKIHET